MLKVKQRNSNSLIYFYQNKPRAILTDIDATLGTSQLSVKPFKRCEGSLYQLMILALILYFVTGRYIS